MSILLFMVTLSLNYLSAQKNGEVWVSDLCKCYNIIDDCTGNPLYLEGNVTFSCRGYDNDIVSVTSKIHREAGVCTYPEIFERDCKDKGVRICLESGNWEICEVQGCNLRVFQTLDFSPQINGNLVGAGNFQVPCQNGGFIACIGRVYDGCLNTIEGADEFEFCNDEEIELYHPGLDIPSASGLCLTVRLLDTDMNPLATQKLAGSDINRGVSRITNIFEGIDNGMYIIEFTLNCCDGNSTCTTNTYQYAYMKIVRTPPLEVEVAFKLGVSNRIEQMLGDPNIDGEIPLPTAPYGPHIGPALSRFSSASATGLTSCIETYTYSIWEVNCNGLISPTLIASYTTPPVHGAQPDDVDFVSILHAAGLGEDYLANNRGKCYKATLSANNACGSVTAEGYFRITDACTFCREEQAIEHVSINFYPSYVVDQAVLQVHNLGSQQVKLTCYSSSGLLVEDYTFSGPRDEKELHHEMTHLMPGLYFYQIQLNGKVHAYGKFIKL